jgi:rsbT co-antagonist protein RsbR
MSTAEQELEEYREYVDRTVAKMMAVVNAAAEWRFDSYCVAERDDDSLGALCLGLNMLVSDTAEAIEENRKAVRKMEMLFESIPDPLFTVDEKLRITSVNSAAVQLSGWSAEEAVGTRCDEVFRSNLCGGECLVRRSMREHSAVKDERATLIRADETKVEALVNASAVLSPDGHLIGGIEIIRDVSEEGRRAQELQEKLDLIQRQQIAIQELSTPVLQLWDGVLALPVIGVVDSRRTAEMMERLLDEIVARQSRFVILDITGVEIVDTKTADNFIKVMKAAQLLGARCVLTGIRPAVAQTLVDLGLDLSSIATLRNLQEGLRECLRQMDRGRAGT